MPSFPVQPDEVTSGWLTATLREAGELGGDRSVSSFTVTPIGDGIGLLGLVVRLELDYDDGLGAAGPRRSSSSSPTPSRRTAPSR